MAIKQISILNLFAYLFNTPPEECQAADAENKLKAFGLLHNETFHISRTIQMPKNGCIKNCQFIANKVFPFFAPLLQADAYCIIEGCLLVSNYRESKLQKLKRYLVG